MFAPAQVLSDLFKGVPRAAISKRMETLKIKRRPCDLAELRSLKAINSVPAGAAKCSLISKTDPEALCTSCKSLGPRRRKRRRRKSRRKERLLLESSGDFFPPPCCGSSGRVLPSPGSQQLQPARGGFFGGVLFGSPGDFQLLHPSAAQPCALPAALGPAGRSRRSPSCSKGFGPPGTGPAAAGKGRCCSFPASKRQGTSAGYSSDSDSSLDLAASSPATSSDSSSSSPPPSPSSPPGAAPPQKERGFGHAGGKDLHKDAADEKSSSWLERPGGASPAPAPSSEPSPELRGNRDPAAPGEPRPEHFDRLIRRSKLWCYAKGFNLDGKTLRRGEERPELWRGAELRFQPRGSTPQNPATIRGRQDGTPKRRRLCRASERQRRNPSKTPPKNPRRNCRKGNAPCKTSPARNSFSLMGNFPCTPSLVVGEDGDLCPASSLGGKNSWALSKTHPLWRWHLGGSAIPVPPSLKFRGCGIPEDP